MAVAHAQEKLLFFNCWIKTLVCVPRIPPVSHPVWVSLNYDFLPQARKQEPPWLTAESSSAATTSQGERGF